MKFRGLMTEVMCMRQFASVIATLAKLSKLCVIRITKNVLYFIIAEESDGPAKPMVWSVLEQSHYFNEYNMAGVTEEQNEIFLEFEPDVMAKSVSTLKGQQGAKSVKIKLTNKKSPCLTFEIMLSEFSHSRKCVHDIPVTVLPRRDWNIFKEPKIPKFDVSIHLPNLRVLRTIAERMKTLSPHVVILANLEGVLILKVETPDATVSTHFRDLPVETTIAEEIEADEYFSVRVDVRKFSQFLSSEQVNPNKVVCNIVDDQMVALFLVHEDVTLHYFLPAITLNTNPEDGKKGKSTRSDGYAMLLTVPDEISEADEEILELESAPRTGSRLEVVSSPSKIGKRSSLMLPKQLENEKKFFKLVSAGDVNAVKEFLRENHGININSVDFKGVTALQIAVNNHNEAMVEFLLTQRGIEVGDCALHAIRNDQSSILVMLLDALAAKNLEFEGCTDSAEFQGYMTPLILAAHCGHYEIVGLLLDRGHSIQHPHSPRCYCLQCQEELKHDDGLKTANHHLNVYRAISSPAYICQTSLDPILTAFELYKELKECTATIIQLRSAYKELADEVKAFAVELIGCCRDSAEVEDILNQWEGCDFAGQVKFPRLVLAMDYGQKQFVAHPNTQEVLDAAWCEDWHEWRRKPEFLKLFTIFPRIILLPYIAIMCIIAPTSGTVAFHNIPVNKLLNSVASYLIFLVLLFIESNQDKSNQKRGPPNTGLEGILVIYVAGLIWSSAKLCMRQGPRRFFYVMVNWYDMIMESLFVVAILFWLSAYIDVTKNDNADLERKYWHHLDPTLMAEGFFAVATIFAFGRLLLLLQLNLTLGPLQVSLGKMLSQDIFKYFLLLAVILLAFSAGLSRLYQYYDGMISVDKETGIKTEQVSSFVGFRSTLKTLFWAIFCMSPVESADVIIENLPPTDTGETLTNYHDFTETVGHICFALFSILVVFLIVNMMIAGLCNTMQKVIDNVDVEWVFGRSVVYVAYMNQTVLPPPFNLLPTAHGISEICGWLKTCFRPEPGKTSKFSFTHCCYVALDVEEERKSNPALMATLCKRYFKQKEEDTSVDSKIEALRQEIEEIRTSLNREHEN